MKEAIYEQLARIGKALASPRRLEILDLLAQAEKPVEMIAEQTRTPLKNTSAHLRELRSARLVETRREGTRIYYRLADESVVRLIRELQGLGERRLVEIQQTTRLFREGRGGLEPVDPTELLRRLREESVVVLDVRPRDEYDAGHLPGALSVPVGELREHLAALPRDREVVAYCRGPYCVYAADAVDVLRGAGFQARRMEAGVPDWRLLGLPVASTEARQPGGRR